MIPKIKEYLLDLQNRLCSMLEQEETRAKFTQDSWVHQEGGGGLTRVLEEGEVIEKSGVNFSHVHGKSLPPAAIERRPELAHSSFQALGVSSVTHPLNPYIPTAHLNVRFIIVQKKDGSTYWWFGGGFDLTPYYGFEEDCVHWHRMAQAACELFGGKDLYLKFKKNCDAYFYLKHRAEPRGIGGLFYDDLNEWGFERSFGFMQSVGDHFIRAYQPIIAQRKQHAFGERERAFQQYRRGRYVEYNLLYDRGTLFGLQSQGRTESILMSLPPTVTWKYQWQTEQGSPEDLLYENFLVSRDWLE